MMRPRTTASPTPTQYIQLTNFADSATSPALSPDGRMLAFIRGPSPFFGPGQVWVKTLPDGEPVQITDDESTQVRAAVHDRRRRDHVYDGYRRRQRNDGHVDRAGARRPAATDAAERGGPDLVQRPGRSAARPVFRDDRHGRPDVDRRVDRRPPRRTNRVRAATAGRHGAPLVSIAGRQLDAGDRDGHPFVAAVPVGAVRRRLRRDGRSAPCRRNARTRRGRPTASGCTSPRRPRTGRTSGVNGFRMAPPSR